MPLNKTVAAKFFSVWDHNSDQNRQLFPDEVALYLTTANTFLQACEDVFKELPNVTNTEYDIQYYMYEVGKKHFGTEKDQLNLWFKCLYSVMFNSENGPRIGQFIYIFGVDEFLKKLKESLDNPFGFRYSNIEFNANIANVSNLA